MTRTLLLAALAVTVAGCTPQGDVQTNQAIAACKRPDVQDVVGKEARNMMLKANEDGVWRAAMFGVNVAEAIEQARVAFGEVGVYADSVQSPYTQIVCTGSMQIDGSSAQAGQDIVTIPNLRWSINFAEPTLDPETASFSIAVDPVSLHDGVLVNGQPAKLRQSSQDSAPSADDASNAQIDGSAAQGNASTDDNALSAADAAAEAEEAAHAGDDVPATPKRPPSDEELYAPHSN